MDKSPSDAELEAYRKKHYKMMRHPLTGELHWILKNPKKDGNSD